MKKNKKLDQQKIKAILIDEIIKKNDCIICSEVPFLSGKRWADLVVLKKNTMIAYEIKSELDSLRKLSGQIRDYMDTFDKVYLVISKKFKDVLVSNKFNKWPADLKKAGIWVVNDNNRIVKQRGAIQKKHPKKSNLSYFLWKKDLKKYLNQDKELNKLRTVFIARKNTTEIKKIAISCLEARYKQRFEMFLHDRYKQTHIDDLRLLTDSHLQIY